MRLSELAGDRRRFRSVTGFALDHRKVAPGNVFGAFRGEQFNGEDFIAEAVEPRRGGGGRAARGDGSRARRISPMPSRGGASPQLAARFYAPYPETVVAVTGTNGKTSTVEMTRQMWRMAGHRSASIGTLGVTTADDQVKTGLTTPDIVTFLNNMAGLERMGISHVAYEASSHGLDQHRGEGVPLTRRGLHQFQPRPPRLPCRHGRLFRGQDAAVRRARWRPTARRSCGPTIRKSDEVIARAARAG